jgi:hypothetical protein
MRTIDGVIITICEQYERMHHRRTSFFDAIALHGEEPVTPTNGKP